LRIAAHILLGLSRMAMHQVANCLKTLNERWHCYQQSREKEHRMEPCWQKISYYDRLQFAEAKNREL
jgi:hypothetical protein